MTKRYKSCFRHDTECRFCSACHHRLDCHNIPIDKPPRLANVDGYPKAYADPRSVVRLAHDGDFTAEEIKKLIADLKELGYNTTPSILDMRKALGMSQKAFADFVGVCTDTIVQWEKNGAGYKEELIRNKILFGI